MPKHKKPISQDPSPRLLRVMPLINEIPHGVILDVACGYGRNGAVFLRMGREVHFIDRNTEALDFIAKEDGLGIKNKKLIKVIELDLDVWLPCWDKDDVAGIIIVHYFNEKLIEYLLQHVKPGGFFFYESIDDRGGNCLELPTVGWFAKRMRGLFKVLHCTERASKHDPQRCTICVLAIRS